MPNKRRSKSINRRRGNRSRGIAKGKKAKVAAQPSAANLAYKFPFDFEASDELLSQGTRILRALQRTIQFSGPDLEQAVAAVFKLASNATLYCAIAACGPRTAPIAQAVAENMDWIAVLRAKNPKNLPWFAGALERLSLKTFHSYSSRCPHKRERGTNPQEEPIREWVYERIHEFWNGVISRSRCVPAIPDDVRMLLLSPENRLNGRKWALELLNRLPKQDGIPFEVFDGSLREEFFKAFTTSDRPSDPAQGFASYVGKRFNPLLRHEVRHAEAAYGILVRERTVPIARPAIGTV